LAKVKLLAFSDLHRDRGQAKRLVELAQQADIVIGAGDFASVRMGIQRAIEPLKAIEKPTVLVPGNNESESELVEACEGWACATLLHGEAADIDGVTFFGLGGGVPVTPFPWSFDLTEEDAAAKLHDCPDGAVLVVHSPPKGYVDEAFGRHLGSEAILRTIEEKRPPLAICGHIHQCWGNEARIGPTRLINVGPDGIMLEL
jgi:Icc-related predicted phosphoesterase